MNIYIYACLITSDRSREAWRKRKEENMRRFGLISDTQSLRRGGAFGLCVVEREHDLW